MVKLAGKCVVVTLAGLAAALALWALAVFLPFRGILGDGLDYEQVKDDATELFEKRRDAFLEAKDAAIAAQTAEGLSVKGVESIRCERVGQSDAVEFAIDAQGMLGGQYWGVYYVSDNRPLLFQLEDAGSHLKAGPRADSYFYREADGNDFYATEMLEDNWYFYYMDYDGNRHGLDWN